MRDFSKAEHALKKKSRDIDETADPHSRVGFAGHTAALHLSYLVRGKADVTVVAPKNRFTWFPSLIWVGTGTMREEETVFALQPVYDKIGVAYVDARAKVINVGT